MRRGSQISIARLLHGRTHREMNPVLISGGRVGRINQLGCPSFYGRRGGRKKKNNAENEPDESNGI